MGAIVLATLEPSAGYLGDVLKKVGRRLLAVTVILRRLQLNWWMCSHQQVQHYFRALAQGRLVCERRPRVKQVEDRNRTHRAADVSSYQHTETGRMSEQACASCKILVSMLSCVKFVGSDLRCICISDLDARRADATLLPDVREAADFPHWTGALPSVSPAGEQAADPMKEEEQGCTASEEAAPARTGVSGTTFKECRRERCPDLHAACAMTRCQCSHTLFWRSMETALDPLDAVVSDASWDHVARDGHGELDPCATTGPSRSKRAAVVRAAKRPRWQHKTPIKTKMTWEDRHTWSS